MLWSFMQFLQEMLILLVDQNYFACLEFDKVFFFFNDCELLSY